METLAEPSESEVENETEKLPVLAADTEQESDSLAQTLIAGTTSEEKLSKAISNGNFLAVASNLINMAREGKLRRELWLLTLITGILFGLSILGERLKAGRKERANGFSDSPEGIVNIYSAGNLNGSTLKSVDTAKEKMAEPARRRMEVEAVLAKTLNEKRAENQDESYAASGVNGIAAERTRSQERTQPSTYSGRSMDRTPNQRPAYGADIAARIREQLSASGSGESYDVHRNNRLGRISGDDNDLRVRLIRQLRDKQWSIADISQELGISREEVRWAMSSTAIGEDVVGHKEEQNQMSLSGGTRNSQARSLMNRKKENIKSADGFRIPIDREKIDQEVDLELQINV